MESINIFSDLRGKVALVTGGYGYLGTAMVEVLSGLGCRVYVLARSEEKFKNVFKNEAKNIFLKKTDVSNFESIEQSVEAIGAKENKIDIFVNNANFGVTNHPEKMTPKEWRRGIEGGLNQFFDCIKAVVPHLKKSENGKIINIASMYGMVVPDLVIYNGREELLNPPNYGTAKAGVIHLTKYYAMYLAKYNINVNAISPGPFPSINIQSDKEFVKRLEAKTQLKRIGKPDDLKGIIALLASSASEFITGQNVAVDGGWTI